MSTLQQLRGLLPRRPLTDHEAHWVIERQANLLRRLHGLEDDPQLPRALIENLPKLHVVADANLPTSGAAHWTGRHWQITINAAEPLTRQRFTLAHEFFHIICHPLVSDLYGNDNEERIEHHCDYFAACLLMPKLLLRQAWVSGGDNQQIGSLALLFGVSRAAMHRRLQQLGLFDSTRRCRDRPAIYYRARPRKPLDLLSVGIAKFDTQGQGGL